MRRDRHCHCQQHRQAQHLALGQRGRRAAPGTIFNGPSVVVVVVVVMWVKTLQCSILPKHPRWELESTAKFIYGALESPTKFVSVLQGLLRHPHAVRYTKTRTGLSIQQQGQDDDDYYDQPIRVCRATTFPAPSSPPPALPL